MPLKSHRKRFEDIPEYLSSLESHHMFRRRRIVGTKQGRILLVDGKQMINFSSNDYLGLAGDARIAKAFSEGIEKWGTGSGASHLISGHTAAHHELEELLAEFTGRPRALLYSSGYAANVGVINALLSVGDFVFEDRLNHASLLDGGWISRANFRWYPHNDIHSLRSALQSNDIGTARTLIVSDGTFSMDGDYCELAALVSAADDHNAWLMIDDAHGFGVVGKHGEGLVAANAYGVEDVQILVGTLGKAFGTSGAFVTGTHDLIETLIQRSRNYIFTTAMPAALAHATKTSLEIVRTEDWRRQRILELVSLFRDGLDDCNAALLPSNSSIQPIVLGAPESALVISRHLEQQGFFVTPIRPPTVPQGSSRLRVTITAAHRESDVTRLAEAIRSAPNL